MVHGRFFVVVLTLVGGGKEWQVRRRRRLVWRPWIGRRTESLSLGGFLSIALESVFGVLGKEDAFIIMKNGVKQRRETTQGWKLLCQWKDGSTNWVALKDMKHSYPVRVAEYAISNRIADEPAFCWWVHNTVKRRDRIIAKVASKYWQRTHRYGIRNPKTVKEAIAIDKENGNTLWWDAICKEMTNV